MLYALRVIICDHCTKPVLRPASRVSGRFAFCDRKCWSEWKKNRSAVGEPLTHAATPKPCATCGEEFTPKPAQVRDGFGKYCSTKCAGQGRRKKSDFDYPTRMGWYLSLGWARLSAEMREGAVCACGAVDKLEVHHRVDPFPTRDRALCLDRSNLVVCCSNCHHREHLPGVEVTCQRCGKRFRVNPARREKARYCGQQCYRARV